MRSVKNILTPTSLRIFCLRLIYKTFATLTERVRLTAARIIKLERYREDWHGPWRKDDTHNREAFQIFFLLAELFSYFLPLTHVDLGSQIMNRPDYRCHGDSYLGVTVTQLRRQCRVFVNTMIKKSTELCLLSKF